MCRCWMSILRVPSSALYRWITSVTQLGTLERLLQAFAAACSYILETFLSVCDTEVGLLGRVSDHWLQL